MTGNADKGIYYIESNIYNIHNNQPAKLGNNLFAATCTATEPPMLYEFNISPIYNSQDN